MKKSKNFELNLNIEFWRIALFTIFTSRKNYGITCAIACLEKRNRNHLIMSIYPIPVEKNLHRIPRFLSSPVSHINNSLESEKLINPCQANVFSYRNQLIDLQWESIGCFQYENKIGLILVKTFVIVTP